MAGLSSLAKKVKAEAKKAKPENIFLKMLDEYLEETDKATSLRPQRKAIRPSSFGRCGRQTYYWLINDEPVASVNSARSVRILKVGTIHHEYMQDTVLQGMSEASGYDFHLINANSPELILPSGVETVTEHHSSPIEIKLLDNRKEIPISMMVDGMFEMGNKTYIFEYKTMNANEFTKLSEPKYEHKIQGSMYAFVTGVRNVMFLYENKNTQELKPFLFEVTDAMLEAIERKIDDMIRRVAENDMPKAEPSHLCTYCAFSTICDRGFNDDGDNEDES